jgi:hypothetical protein
MRDVLKIYFILFAPLWCSLCSNPPPRSNRNGLPSPLFHLRYTAIHDR